MRLLYILDSLAPGGAETSLAEMAPQLVADGLDLHVLSLGSRMDLAPALEATGATIHTGKGRTGRVGNVMLTISIIREIRPHLIHTTLYESDIAGRTAAMLTRTPVSSSVVGDTYGPVRAAEVNAHRLQTALALDRVTARKVSLFHAVSLSLAESVHHNLRVPRERIEVIPRGRNADKYPFRPKGLRSTTRVSLGVASERPVIVAVGRLERTKGHIHLLRALPLLAKAHPDLVVLFAGKDGRSSEELRLAARASGLDIRFLGHRSDVASLLAAADVLCFPSLSEGSPGTLIEAMAVGCPIVASDIAANQEVLGGSNSCCGTLFPVGDHQQLAKALAHLLDDTRRSDRQAEQGRKRFEEQYTVGAIGHRMNHFFRRAALRDITPGSR